MRKADDKKISLKVIRRVLFYYEALLKDPSPKNAYISSKKIQNITGISSNQIRQDLFYLNLSIGKQKKGYISHGTGIDLLYFSSSHEF